MSTIAGRTGDGRRPYAGRSAHDADPTTVRVMPTAETHTVVNFPSNYHRKTSSFTFMPTGRTQRVIEHVSANGKPCAFARDLKNESLYSRFSKIIIRKKRFVAVTIVFYVL